MSTFLLAQLFCIVAALVASFGMLVWPGIRNVPTWMVYASMFALAAGAGAAINLIFSKV